MSRKTYQFKVNGIDYEATTFAGKLGIKHISRLMKLVGPAIIKSVLSFDKNKKTIDTDVIAMAAQSLIVNMDADNIDNLIDDLLESVTCIIDGKKVKADLDNYFAAEYGALFKVIFEVLKENYLSFLPEGGFNPLDLMPSVKVQE